MAADRPDLPPGDPRLVREWARQGRVLAAAYAACPAAQGLRGVVVHPNRASLRPVDAARRRALAENLEKELADLARGLCSPRVTATEVPPAAPLGRAVCTACRGGCCRAGGDHAFLDADSLMRVLDDGTVARAGIVDLYLGHVPAAAMEGSCIFHGAAGCTLPRTLRGNLCNSFHCDPLAELLRTAAPEATERVMVALALDEQLVGAEVVDPAA
jgi:hypothetical protein